MLISILLSTSSIDPVAVVGQDLLGAGSTKMSTHGKHMLERKKDTKPNFTATWKIMTEVCKAVAVGPFPCNELMPTFICACVYVFSALLLLNFLNKLREVGLLF